MKNTTNTDEAPTLTAERTEGRGVKVWCGYCRTGPRSPGAWHYHGDGGSSGPELGHRGAHCWNRGSPYLATGYNLRLGEDGHRG